jgi:hypothetical protein
MGIISKWSKNISEYRFKKNLNLYYSVRVTEPRKLTFIQCLHSLTSNLRTVCNLPILIFYIF